MLKYNFSSLTAKMTMTLAGVIFMSSAIGAIAAPQFPLEPLDPVNSCFNPKILPESPPPLRVTPAPGYWYLHAVNDVTCTNTYISFIFQPRRTPGVKIAAIESTPSPAAKNIKLFVDREAAADTKMPICIQVRELYTNKYLGEKCFDVELDTGECYCDWRISGIDYNGNPVDVIRPGYVDNQGCGIHWEGHTIIGCGVTRGLDGRIARWYDIDGDRCPDWVRVYNYPSHPDEWFKVTCK